LPLLPFVPFAGIRQKGKDGKVARLVKIEIRLILGGSLQKKELVGELLLSSKAGNCA